jgi:hypothetical protein
MMLFHVSKDGKALLHKDVYKLCPELSILNEDEVMYIVMVYDYYSPYHQIELEDRRKRISKIYNLKENIEDSVKIKSAINLYLSLQYDGRRAIVYEYKKKIKMLSVELMHPDCSPSKITQILSSQDLLKTKIEDLEKEIEFSMLQANLKGGRTKSLIEYMQENRKLYEMEMDNSTDIDIRPSWVIPSSNE